MLPAWPFRASGLALLAGDVVLLSGAAAHRAALLVALAGHAVLLLALWSLAATAISLHHRQCCGREAATARSGDTALSVTLRLTGRLHPIRPVGLGTAAG